MKREKKHIIIINSPLFEIKNILYDEDSLPPIGLGYIATKLQNNNVNVDLVDAIADKMPLKNLIEFLNSKNPDFIGVNIFTTNYDLVKKLILSLEVSSHIIIGGLSTKELYKKILKWKTDNQIDIVAGDGELITLDIVNNSLNEEPLIITKNRRFFRIDNKSKYYIKNIDDLDLNRDFFNNEPINHPLGFKEVNLIMSRGCIYNCSFCAAAYSMNKEFGIRERSIKSIQDELALIKKNYPNTNSIRVLDDLFLKKRKHVIQAAKIFENFDFKWRSMAHVMTFNRVSFDEIIKLKNSGCSELFMGIESGSPKILKSLNKTSNIDLILKNLTSVLKGGIALKVYFIYGFPNETKEDMDLTYNLALKLSKVAKKYNVNFRTSVFQFRPYHGTEIYNDLVHKGEGLSDVERITPNHSLSRLVARIQFNFHSKNFSKVGLDTIHDYICRTTNLNSTNLIDVLESKNRA